MKRTAYVNTIDFGYVPISKTYTDGVEQTIIDLSYDESCPNEWYASIRLDFRTNQPFAVILDENLEEV